MITICINITSFVLIHQLEKDHSMIETLVLTNVVVFVMFFQTKLSFVLSRKIIFNIFSACIYIYIHIYIYIYIYIYVCMYKQLKRHLIFLFHYFSEHFWFWCFFINMLLQRFIWQSYSRGSSNIYRLKSEVNSFLESFGNFYFDSAFIFVTESF